MGSGICIDMLLTFWHLPGGVGIWAGVLRAGFLCFFLLLCTFCLNTSFSVVACKLAFMFSFVSSVIAMLGNGGEGCQCRSGAGQSMCRVDFRDCPWS